MRRDTSARMRGWVLALATALSLFAFGNAAAQEYPTRPVTVIYSFAAGAGDVAVRAIAADLTSMWKQSVIVEIKAGGSGVLGYNTMKAARPDGYTFAVYHNGLAVIRRVADPAFTADVGKDYEPVVMLYENYATLTAHPSAPFKTFAEFVRYAKANPGKINLARGGFGSADHVVEEVLKTQLGIDFASVPYNGAGPAIQGVLSGQVHGILTSAQMHTFVNQKRLIAIAAFTEKPSGELAGWPGLLDIGIPGEQIIQNWQGLYTTTGVPRNIIAKVNQDINKVLAGPTGSKLGGNTAVGGTPEQQAQRIRSEIERFGSVIKKLEVKFD